jgi:lantibiotic biosynthesis protein
MTTGPSASPLHRAAYAAAERLAGDLATPHTDLSVLPGSAQSLTRGAAGVALLHIERAHAGLGSWGTVQDWVTAASREPLSAALNAGLHHGVPALAFVLHAARADGVDRYDPAYLRLLDTAVSDLVHRRVEQAEARIDGGVAPTFDEYDAFAGLTGIGAHLLRHRPGSDALPRVLAYLVQLTRPQHRDGVTLPGWWVDHTPHGSRVIDVDGGHANLGLAHGISGPLALLAQAIRAGVTVDGHTDAIATICDWMDRWRQNTPTGPAWPEIVNHEHRRAEKASVPPNRRPSWCYGTPGIARAQQLAGLALGDPARQHLAEHALANCLAGHSQLDQVPDNSLCHGWAGLYLTVRYAAHDASTGILTNYLPRLADRLVRRTATEDVTGDGLLEGSAGLALALHQLASTSAPISGWDTWLLNT